MEGLAKKRIMAFLYERMKSRNECDVSLAGLLSSRAASGFLYQGMDERELKGMTTVTGGARWKNRGGVTKV